MSTGIRKLRVALVGLLAASTLVACGAGEGGSDSGDNKPQTGGKLAFVVSADATGFNPVKDSFSGQTYTMARAIMESLTALDKDGNWQPYLAESVKANSDATKWVIKVRKGVTFSTGEALDAKTVADNLEAQKAAPLNAGTLANLASIKAVDTMTVEVTMSKPFATFPMYLATQIGMVIPEASLKNPTQASTKPVGTGPFIFADHVQDSSMKVTKNDRYWRASEGLPYLDEVDFHVIPDGKQRTLAVQSNSVDGMSTRDPQDIVKLGDDPSYRVTRVKGMAVPESVFFLNTASSSGLQDVDLRRALAMATDQEAFIKTLRAGLTKPATGPWSEDTPWYVKTDYPTYDLDAAKAAISSYESTHGQVKLTLMTLSDAAAMQSAQLLQDMWKEAGVELKIDPLDQGTLVQRLVTGDYDVSSAVEFSSADPDMSRVLFHSSGLAPMGQLSPVITRLKDAALDEGFDKGRASTDLATRKAAYAQVQQRLAELVPVIWIDHLDTAAVITSDKVHGVGESKLPSGQVESGPYGNPSPSLTFVSVWIEH